jgi:pimeloyl-ACP methyl ester carboxylesterase
MVPGLDHRTLTTRDGTRIAYQVRGQGPAIVLANGLGGTYEAFRHVYAELGDAYRVLCWDYRGLYGSATPADRSRMQMTHQCDDLEELLDHEQIDRAVFVGWSMGVQLNYEFFRKRGRRMDGIVAINGTYGRPFETVMASRVVSHIIPVMMRAVRAQAALVGRATRSVVGWQGLVGMLQRFGMVSKTLDVEAFRDVAEGFKTMDWKNYTDLIEQLGAHDAEDVLPTVDVPTLIITGDRDIITPPFTAERMHRAIGGSRLVVIAGGTHYTPVEFPAVIREELRDFLDRVPGYGRAAVGRAARG